MRIIFASTDTVKETVLDVPRLPREFVGLTERSRGKLWRNSWARERQVSVVRLVSNCVLDTRFTQVSRK